MAGNRQYVQAEFFEKEFDKGTILKETDKV